MYKLSNKGQAFVIFIIFIPMFIMIGILVVDISNSKYEKRRLDEVNKMTIKKSLSNINSASESEILDLFNKNNLEIDSYNISVDEENNVIKVTINKKIKGVFGKIINKDIYDIKSSYVGYIENNKVIINRGD